METRILAGIIITGILATSAAQAGTSLPIEEFHSGLNSATAQQVQQSATQQTVAHKATCRWRVVKNDLDPLYAPYHWKNHPNSNHFTPPTQNFDFDFVC